MAKNQMDKEYANSIFKYNIDTGNLEWAVNRSFNIKIGDVVGFKDKFGYTRFEHKKKTYFAHVVIWNYFNGLIPSDMTVDHKKSISLGGDNKITNLQLLTMQDNNRKRKHQKNNKSGYRGVCFCNTSMKWLSQIRLDRKTVHLGRFDCPKKAALAYNTKAAELFGEYAVLNVVED